MFLLYSLFNCILDIGFFFKSWFFFIIVFVYKKGDCINFDNYRGISLVSNMVKLFIFILNNRLLDWLKINDVIMDV